MPQTRASVDSASVFKGEIPDSLARLAQAITTCNEFAGAFDLYKAKVDREYPERYWRVDRDHIFARLFKFRDRLNNLVELLRSFVSFAKLEKGEVGGPKVSPRGARRLGWLWWRSECSCSDGGLNTHVCSLLVLMPPPPFLPLGCPRVSTSGHHPVADVAKCHALRCLSCNASVMVLFVPFGDLHCSVLHGRRLTRRVKT